MKSLKLSLILALSMIAVAIAAFALRPAPVGKPPAPKFELERLIPASFGGWRLVETGGAQVVNPQVQQQLDTLYSQHLTRTYANADGYRVMLSIAYGDDQRSGMQVHMPDVCYPAQGFTILERTIGAIRVADAPIEVTRMEARMGTRVEPVTYWFTLGEQSFAGISKFDRRLAELRFALRGDVPDGLLFRVSSIDDQRERAFRQQEQFAGELLAAVGPSGRVHLIGAARN